MPADVDPELRGRGVYPYPGPVIPAPRMLALADKVDELAQRLERQGAPDLETARSRREQAARARAEATMLRRRAAAPRLHEQLMRLRGWPAPTARPPVASPRARSSRARPVARRTTRAAAARGSPGSSSGDDDPEPPLDPPDRRAA
jgi:hypothetical protein